MRATTVEDKEKEEKKKEEKEKQSQASVKVIKGKGGAKIEIYTAPENPSDEWCPCAGHS